MKVSVLQMPVAIGAREENMATLRRMLDAAMKDAPDVVVLPELWDIGFFPRPLENYVDEDGAQAQELLSSLAKKHRVHIVGGSVAVKVGDYIANRCYVLIGTAPLSPITTRRTFSLRRRKRNFSARATIALSFLSTACGAL